MIAGYGAVPEVGYCMDAVHEIDLPLFEAVMVKALEAKEAVRLE